jgi:hypothetical protein
MRRGSCAGTGDWGRCRGEATTASFRLPCTQSAGRGKINTMSSVGEIEEAIERLSPEDLRALREWFAERDAAEWDKQFETDVASGKLDSLAEQAIRDLREGRCKDL